MNFLKCSAVHCHCAKATFKYYATMDQRLYPTEFFYDQSMVLQAGSVSYKPEELCFMCMELDNQLRGLGQVTVGSTKAIAAPVVQAAVAIALRLNWLLKIFIAVVEKSYATDDAAIAAGVTLAPGQAIDTTNTVFCLIVQEHGMAYFLPCVLQFLRAL